MLRLVCFSLFVALVASQGLTELLAFQAMMSPSGSSQSSSSSLTDMGSYPGRSGGSSSRLGSSMTGLAGAMGSMGSSSGSSSSQGMGPLAALFSSGMGSSRGRNRGGRGNRLQSMMLCRAFDMRRTNFPCGRMPQICDMESLSQYNMPGLLSCSPFGIGCCPSSMRALFLINAN